MRTPDPLDVGRRLRVSGNGTAGTVLMLHALGLDGRAFDPLRDALDSRWRIVSLDLPGHGVAASHVDFTLDECVQQTLRTLDCCCSEPIHLVGHSMGGAIAALAAAQAGAARIASLAVVASPPRGAPVFAARGDTAIAPGIEAVIPTTLARWFGSDGSAGDGRAFAYARAALGEMRTAGFSSAWRALASFGGYESLAARLPRTLAIAGDRDLSTPPPVMQEIVGAFAQAGHGDRIRLRTVRGSGHMLVLEAANEVAALLDAHWTEV